MQTESARSTLWLCPFDLKPGARVTCDTINFPLNFGLTIYVVSQKFYTLLVRKNLINF